MVSIASYRRIEINETIDCINVSEMQRKIEFELNEYKTIIISLKKLKRIDLSGLYMIYLLKQKSPANTIILEGLENSAFLKAIEKTGTAHLLYKIRA
ncbi:STAS domain-containing protein [Leeuwenhoekiella palythoae]|uniref:STAS domain-containing protein n=1 Tax=Leeuwenhoekiella palythoae TaxID=573501 RepID=A0A1M5YAY3_9FLAO|nr:STAS domain-containing protein [Leeuwenhoekiella palythoae]MEC7784066.1 STAS domain-containing protein [Bacteroidota bacterium]MEE3148901.1 STAS domain-containing protein [Bacteroidota bacterium]RXG30608.1 hypothetical protein DSM01_1359 [Leeuwenhoekiella palythoae]SHI09142.1 hypothetical protein SAMN04487999_2068 [Leeuwenhoekiella palythoae]